MEKQKEMGKLAKLNKKYKIFIIAAVFLAILAMTLVVAIPLSI
ncbi:hypothetical protein [Mycoplasma todarodis]